MKKRWFAVIGGALALLLAYPSTGSAQVLFGLPFGGYGMMGGMYGMMGGYSLGMSRMWGPVGYNYYIPQTPSVTYNSMVPLYSGLTSAGMNGSFFRTAVNNPAMYNYPSYAANSPFYYSAPTMTAVSGGLQRASNVSNVAFSQNSRRVDNRATIEVRVPPIATVWFDGELTRETGRDRLFHSPPLDPQKRYRYSVKAVWPDANGKNVVQNATVQVTAGQVSRVVFPKAKEEPKEEPMEPREKAKPTKPEATPDKEKKPALGPGKEGEAKPGKDNKGGAGKDKR